MPSKYSVAVKEFGRGKAAHRRFSSLADLQKYVRDRWEGPDYIDGLSVWHNDYCTFKLTGATLADLGKRGGPHGTDAYWDWQWHALEPAQAPAAPAPALSPLDVCQLCGEPLDAHRYASDNSAPYCMSPRSHFSDRFVRGVKL